MLLVVRPDAYSDRTADALSGYRTPIATWAIDSLQRCPSQSSLSSISIASFFIDASDLKNATHVWLPLGADDALLKQVSGKKDLDVLFIGNLERPYYAKRRGCLLDLMGSALPNRFKCAAVVREGSRFKDEILQLRAPFPVSRSLSIKDYAEAISRATVCVNVLQDDGVSPVNDTFFMIPGTGTCQLCDERSYLAQWLRPDFHFAWFSRADMIGQLEALLRDPKKTRSIADTGRREVMDKHTYAKRAEIVIETIGQALGG